MKWVERLCQLLAPPAIEPVRLVPVNWRINKVCVELIKPLQCRTKLIPAGKVIACDASFATQLVRCGWAMCAPWPEDRLQPRNDEP